MRTQKIKATSLWNRLPTRIACAGISGVALALCVSGWNLPWLGWVALTPLFLSLWDATGKTAFGLGFLAGLVRALVSWQWVAPTLHLMTGGWAISVVVFAVLCLTLALAFGFYAVLHVRLCCVMRAESGTQIGLMLAVAALWVSFEFASDLANDRLSLVFVSNVGFSQWCWPASLQVAAWTGVYGISFLLAAWSMAWAIWARTLAVLPLEISCLLALISLTCGSVRLMAEPGRAPIRVAILQGNVDPHDKLNPQKEKDIAERYFHLCEEANAARSQLIIWTEGAISWGVGEGDPFLENVLALTASSGASHLVGVWLNSSTIAAHRFFNASLLMLPDGRIVDIYKKQALLPFAERQVNLGAGGWSLTPEAVEVGFDPGKETHLTASPVGRFAVTLCNESVYSGKTREMARMGADFLVNMGNDAWTPGTWALRQHLTVNVMRAVEVGLWYVIANNSGISGIVDHHGVVRSRSMPRTSACLVGEVRPDARPSFYAKHGDIFAGICVLAAIAGLSAKSKRGERGEK